MATRDALLARLGSLLRARRTSAGWTQREVALRADLSPKYISEIERGTRDVPINTLRAIVEDGLGLAVDIRFPPRAGAAVARDALPRPVDEVARLVADLPEDRRAEVVRLIRALVKLAAR
ncbi:MAG: helix-turn-helix domain-containing protein [Deltaproteobacteria bacterium]|nr:helix-turn-helix domain-containing protein [Deltaproteobacteria bacterium]MCW5801566.1 helix-turn-helix domain-containing protein [Deltaproteobacteria bacterium]